MRVCVSCKRRLSSALLVKFSFSFFQELRMGYIRRKSLHAVTAIQIYVTVPRCIRQLFTVQSIFFCVLVPSVFSFSSWSKHGAGCVTWTAFRASLRTSFFFRGERDFSSVEKTQRFLVSINLELSYMPIQPTNITYSRVVLYRYSETSSKFTFMLSLSLYAPASEYPLLKRLRKARSLGRPSSADGQFSWQSPQSHRW